MRNIIHLNIQVRFTVATLIAFICYLSLGVNSLIAENESGEASTLKSYYEDSENIILTCQYSFEWTPPAEHVTNGILTYEATIVDVIKGNYKIGQKIKYSFGIENGRSFPGKPFRAAAGGELRYVFVDDEAAIIENNLVSIQGDMHWGFAFESSIFKKLLDELIQ